MAQKLPNCGAYRTGPALNSSRCSEFNIPQPSTSIFTFTIYAVWRAEHHNCRGDAGTGKGRANAGERPSALQPGLLEHRAELLALARLAQQRSEPFARKQREPIEDALRLPFRLGLVPGLGISRS